MSFFHGNGYSSKHDFIYPRMVMIMKPMAVTVIIKSWAAVLKIVGMSWLWCSWIFRGLWWKRSQNTSSTLIYCTHYDTTLMKMPKCEIFLEKVFFEKLYHYWSGLFNILEILYRCWSKSQEGHSGGREDFASQGVLSNNTWRLVLYKYYSNWKENVQLL